MTDTTDVKTSEQCDHPETSRFTYDYGPNGYLNTPKGERILCGDCGTDLTDGSPPTVGTAVYPCTVCGGNVKVHARDIDFDEGEVTGGYVHFGCMAARS